MEGYFRKNTLKIKSKGIYKNCLPENEIYHLNGRQHYPLNLFDKYDGIKDYFKFTFTRHPLDRLVSAYEYFFNKHSFNYFIKVILRLSAIKNDLSDNYINHLKPQYQFLRSKILKLDFVGRFDHLEADFQELQNKLGLDIINIPHIFKIKRRPYQDYFNEKTRSIAERIYRKDFELLEYKPFI